MKSKLIRIKEDLIEGLKEINFDVNIAIRELLESKGAVKKGAKDCNNSVTPEAIITTLVTPLTEELKKLKHSIEQTKGKFQIKIRPECTAEEEGNHIGNTNKMVTKTYNPEVKEKVNDRDVDTNKTIPEPDELDFIGQYTTSQEGARAGLILHANKTFGKERVEFLIKEHCK